MPVHIEMDSSIPPISAPNKFDPSASLRNPSQAKLLMNTIPAKKTGKHNINAAVSPFTQADEKKKLSMGTR